MTKFLIPPDQTGYSYSRGKEVIITELDGGVSKRRRDIIGASSYIDCEWIFNLEDYQYFCAFYDIETENGVLPFTIDLILDDSSIAEYTARFVPNSLRATDPVGLSVRQNATLEVTPVDNTDFHEIVLLLYGETGYLELLEELTNFDLDVS